MYFYEILFGKDYAYQLLDAVGQLEFVQFVNLNKNELKAQLHNVAQIKQCEKVIGKINQVK